MKILCLDIEIYHDEKLRRDILRIKTLNKTGKKRQKRFKIEKNDAKKRQL